MRFTARRGSFSPDTTVLGNGRPSLASRLAARRVHTLPLWTVRRSKRSTGPFYLPSAKRSSPPPGLAGRRVGLQILLIHLGAKTGRGRDFHFSAPDLEGIFAAQGELQRAARHFDARTVEGRRRHLLRRHIEQQAADIVQGDGNAVAAGKIG